MVVSLLKSQDMTHLIGEEITGGVLAGVFAPVWFATDEDVYPWDEVNSFQFGYGNAVGDLSMGNHWSESGPDLYQFPSTTWGDYVGDDVQRSNNRSLLRDFPDVFKEVDGDYGYSTLVIRASDLLANDGYLLDIGRQLAHEYPLYDESDHSALEMELADDAWDAYLYLDVPASILDALEDDWEPFSHYVYDIDSGVLREAFYRLVSESADSPYCESATGVVFPMMATVVAQLATMVRAGEL